MMTEEKTKLSFLVILSALMAFTSLSTDIYLPAMPAMQATLGGSVQLTITGFVVGFAIAQLIWGPISDRIGRKLPLMLGTALFAIASIAISFSSSMEAVVAWRVLQAIGACVGPMLSRTMVRDLYSASKAAQMLSTLMIIMAVAPIVGPLLGGMILKFGDWQHIFYLIAGIAVMLLFFIPTLPETLPKEKRTQSTSLGQAFRNYGKLLDMKGFMLYTLSVTFFYIGAYAFITESSVIYIEHFHVPAQYYGFLFGLNMIGITVVSFFNRSLVNRFSLATLLKTSTTIAFLAGLWLALDSFTGFWGLWGIAVPMLLAFSMNGIIGACSNAAALAKAPDNITGSAAALLGSMQYGSGFVSSVLLAIFSNGTPIAMGVIIAVSLFLAMVSAYGAAVLEKKEQKGKSNSWENEKQMNWQRETN